MQNNEEWNSTTIGLLIAGFIWWPFWIALAVVRCTQGQSKRAA